MYYSIFAGVTWYTSKDISYLQYRLILLSSTHPTNFAPVLYISTYCRFGVRLYCFNTHSAPLLHFSADTSFSYRCFSICVLFYRLLVYKRANNFRLQFYVCFCYDVYSGHAFSFIPCLHCLNLFVLRSLTNYDVRQMLVAQHVFQ